MDGERPRALVYGLAITGVSTVRALRRHGYDVVVADDVVDDAKIELAAELGVVDRTLIDGTLIDIDDLVEGCSLLSPSPGLPETHRVIDAAARAGVEVVSELELAYRWEQRRRGGPRPILAVTGTDGKTSTTKMAVAMLQAGGRSAIDAGNTDTPLVDALEMDVDVFVVECSSFRLAFTPSFRAEAAAWLNLQPDHLNWHRSMESYEAAKAQIFANQRTGDVAIGNIDDSVVMDHAVGSPGRTVTVGLIDADYRCVDGVLAGPSGPIATTEDMRRSLPHDITNALTAAALVIESGLATADDVAAALAAFEAPAHRIERLATIDGADWYNDSKATTPHAASAAIRSFERIVLIAGGADKGVDLTPMTIEAHRVVGVIGIGTTASAVTSMFAAANGSIRTEVVETLAQAVPLARNWARPGDTVLLSPGCASLDQFKNYEARGEHFRSLVNTLATTIGAS